MTSILMVGGTFDDGGGKASRVASALFDGVQRSLFDHGTPYDTLQATNGGHWSVLEGLLQRAKGCDLVFWLADVPNDKPKLVDRIKELSPTCLLVTSKRNLEGKYSPMMLVARALKTRSNLLLEVTGNGPPYGFTIWDPLGNTFATQEADVGVLAEKLAARVAFLMRKVTRVRSESVGKAILPDEVMAITAKGDLVDFCGIVAGHGKTFHELIHADATRFLGNASFRCEQGFPSMRHGEMVFVSRRNIDKRDMNPMSFVAVEMGLVNAVRYHGPDKPSVDTPAQLDLYAYFKSAKFMLHSHVYALGAPFTESVLPCGALEEAQEVVRLFAGPNRVGLKAPNVAVNLRGHGSLVIARDLSFLRGVHYVGRTIPEEQG